MLTVREEALLRLGETREGRTIILGRGWAEEFAEAAKKHTPGPCKCRPWTSRLRRWFCGAWDNHGWTGL